MTRNLVWLLFGVCLTSAYCYADAKTDEIFSKAEGDLLQSVTESRENQYIPEMMELISEKAFVFLKKKEEVIKNNEEEFKKHAFASLAIYNSWKGVGRLVMEVTFPIANRIGEVDPYWHITPTWTDTIHTGEAADSFAAWDFATTAAPITYVVHWAYSVAPWYKYDGTFKNAPIMDEAIAFIANRVVNTLERYPLEPLKGRLIYRTAELAAIRFYAEQEDRILTLAYDNVTRGNARVEPLPRLRELVNEVADRTKAERPNAGPWLIFHKYLWSI